MDINRETTKLIRKEIDASKLSDAAVSEKSGIAYSTLNRKLKGGGQWTATEIYRISNAIRVEYRTLIPAVLLEAHAA